MFDAIKKHMHKTIVAHEITKINPNLSNQFKIVRKCFKNLIYFVSFCINKQKRMLELRIFFFIILDEVFNTYLSIYLSTCLKKPNTQERREENEHWVVLVSSVIQQIYMHIYMCINSLLYSYYFENNTHQRRGNNMMKIFEKKEIKMYIIMKALLYSLLCARSIVHY